MPKTTYIIVLKRGTGECIIHGCDLTHLEPLSEGLKYEILIEYPDTNNGIGSARILSYRIIGDGEKERRDYHYGPGGETHFDGRRREQYSVYGPFQ